MLKDSRAVYTPGLSEHAGSASKFYQADALGSTRGITDATQATTDAVLYDAFGMTVSRTGSTVTPFGFVGAQQYQTDADSGLQLLGHRYYDASVGRFISADPAKAGTNWYAYCENGPLRATDPQGLDDHGSDQDHHGAVYNAGNGGSLICWDHGGTLYWSKLPIGFATRPDKVDIDYVKDGGVWHHTFPSGGDYIVGAESGGCVSIPASGVGASGFPTDMEPDLPGRRRWHWVSPGHLSDIGWITPIGASPPPRIPGQVPIQRVLPRILQIDIGLKYTGPIMPFRP